MQNSSKSVGDDNALKRLSSMRNLLSDPNDRKTHLDVMTAFDRAVHFCEKGIK